MKTILALYLFASFTSYAANSWNELEVSETYHLSQSLPLDSSWSLAAGTQFYFEEMIPTDIYFQLRLRQTECVNYDQVSDLVLYNPSPEDPYFNRSVGLQMEEGCLLNIYLEPTDYYTPSVF